jgi:predicted aspartyl protease
VAMPFGLPTVTARASGRELSFLLDSGSEFCLLRPEIVEELDLPVSGIVRLSLLGETAESRITCLHEFSIGAIRCSHIPFVVTPGHLQRTLLGFQIERIDGVLGMPFLAHFSTTFDFSRGLVHCAPAQALAVTHGDGVHVVPLTFLNDGRPCVAAAPGDGKNHTFIVDTGSRRCLIAGALARALGLPRFETVRLMGLGVELAATLTQLPELALADVLLTRVRAYVIPDAQKHLLRQVEGLIGIEVLMDFTVTIDPVGGRLILVER